MKIKSVLLFLVCLFCIQAVCLSDESKESALGVGILYYQRPYKSVGASVLPVPIIIGEYKGFYSDARSVGYYLNKNEFLKFSVVASPRFMGYQGDDSYELSGMEHRKWSIDGGLRGEWINKLFDLKVTALTDLLNNHQGQEIKAALSKELLKGFLTPRAGVKWQSKDLTAYYYGVEGNEARFDRPEYIPQDALNYFSGILFKVPLGKKWAAILDFEYEHLDSEIEKSPIVDNNNTVTAIAGAVYKF